MLTLQEAACIDLSVEVTRAALEVIRKHIEDAAAEAKEMQAQDLLRELAEEEVAKKTVRFLNFWNPREVKFKPRSMFKIAV